MQRSILYSKGHAKGQISFTMEASPLLTVNGYSLTYVCVKASLVILYYVSSVKFCSESVVGDVVLIDYNAT